MPGQDLDLFQRHELLSKVRYNELQQALDLCVSSSPPDIAHLNARLDAQLKLEEFLIKSRVAEHPKMATWAPMAISLVAIAVSIATVVFRD